MEVFEKKTKTKNQNQPKKDQARIMLAKKLIKTIASQDFGNSENK